MLTHVFRQKDQGKEPSEQARDGLSVRSNNACVCGLGFRVCWYVERDALEPDVVSYNREI